jgi:3-phosphoshikimate 1-carboxyvinyltransferase
MNRLTLDARRPRAARLTPPPSKSDALRVLALAHILDRPSWVSAIGPKPWASDIDAFADGLEALRSAGTGGRRGSGTEAGATLVHQSGDPPGRFRFVGTARLGTRPHAPLLAALSRALGPSGLVIRTGDPWPIEVESRGATDQPLFRVSGAESSQYASSLVLAAAALFQREQRPWNVEIDDQMVSEGYLELTLRALRRSGFRVDRSRSSLEILAWDARATTAPAVPADWSGSAFLLPIAWRIGGSVAGLGDSKALGDIHPDRAIVGHLHHVGLELDSRNPPPWPSPLLRNGEGMADTRVVGTLHRGLRASGAKSPDLLPALAALACLLPDTSVFTAISRLRGKESDRLAAIQNLIAAGGATSHLDGDSLRIEPANPLRLGSPDPLRFDARDDHRMIMAAATLAVLLGTRLELEGAGGVEKSFPGFFGQLALAGIELC